MNRIRLTYASLKYFILKVSSYLIGIIFPIYIARILPVPEYGIYGFIVSMWTTFDIFKNVIPFWSGRMIARGGRFVKSSMASNLLISIPLTIIYILLGPLISNVVGVSLSIYLISSIYIPLSYGISALTSYIKMRVPDKLGYGPMTLSLIKISIGLVLVKYIGLFGAITTLLIGYVLYFICFLKISVSEFEEKVNLGIIKEWLKGSWYVTLLSIAHRLYDNLAILMLGFIGATVSLGSYYVAVRAARWIGLTSGLSIALTPYLLSEKGGEREILRTIYLVSMFATPMLIGILVMNQAIVYVFGGLEAGELKYGEAVIPLLILAIARYIDVYTNLSQNIVFSYEKFDIDFMIRIRELIKSRMFLVLIFRYIGVATLAISILILYPLYGLNGLAYSMLITSIVLFTSIGLLGRKNISSYGYILSKLARFTLSSLIMAGILYILPKYRTLVIVADIFIGIGIYFTVLYLIDRDFRILIKKGLEEISRFITSLTIEESG